MYFAVCLVVVVIGGEEAVFFMIHFTPAATKSASVFELATTAAAQGAFQLDPRAEDCELNPSESAFKSTSESNLESSLQQHRAGSCSSL